MAGPKPMKEETLRSVVAALIADAEDYRDELADLREPTTHAYNGDLYGNEQEGRSQFITRDVRDAVEMAKPAIMRILFGSNSIVEFAGQGPEDVVPAREATDMVKYMIRANPNSYVEGLSGVDDALIRKMGAFKVVWETDDTPVATYVESLSLDDANALVADPDVISVDLELSDDEDEDGRPVGEEYPATIVRKADSVGRTTYTAIPVEELLVSRDARHFNTARLVGHQREVTVSDLVGMGYDWDEVIELAAADEMDDNTEEDARSVGSTTNEVDDGEGDPSQQKVVFSECWVRVDADGDGLAELRRICTGGSGHKILTNELVEYAPVAGICPSPVAHQVVGNSLAELVEDVQKLKTVLMRNTIDSLANAIHPDVEAVENQVNFDDLLNSEQGRIIRVKAPGMINYLSQPFVGQQVFPLMQYLDTLSEARTGMNEASQGLNADALQSTARKAIENATAAAQSRIEFIARNLLETGFKRLFYLMMRVTRDNAPKALWMRVNNDYTKVDPRSWNASMDVETTVALGEGTMEQRFSTLASIAARQEQIIQTAGVDNPLCGIQEYRNTLVDMTRMAGLVRVERYFKDPADPNNQPQPKQPPPPTPEEIIAKNEVEKTRREEARKDREFLLKAWEAEQKDDRERDKMIADVMIKAQELAKEGRKLDVAEIQAMLQRERNEGDFLTALVREVNAERAAETQAAGNQQAMGTGPSTGGSNGAV